MYKIPPDDAVLLAMQDVLVKYKSVDSQHKLKRLVEKALSSGGDEYRVGEKRLRLMALKAGVARLDIKYRETDEKKAMALCPVCGERLVRERNQTVFGGTVTLGYKCKGCPYATGVKRRVPVRYIFTMRR
jgi:hypothetical protein